MYALYLLDVYGPPGGHSLLYIQYVREAVLIEVIRSQINGTFCNKCRPSTRYLCVSNECLYLPEGGEGPFSPA